MAHYQRFGLWLFLLAAVALGISFSTTRHARREPLKLETRNAERVGFNLPQ